jgi:hypothetical protein
MENTENTEKISKYVKGYFKIELLKDDEVLYEYEDKNKVLIWVYKNFSNTVYGFNVPDIDDCRIHAVALGTDGVELNGSLKEIQYDRKRMYSEDRFWTGDFFLGEKSYVYQATFGRPSSEGTHYAFKYNEGTTFPHHAGSPKNYRGQAYNDIEEKEAGLSIERYFANNTIYQTIYLGKLAGNGHPMWDNPPKFSEAALYMTSGATESGDYLGTLFSMKTFPEMPKTDGCVIKIQWNLDFNID